MKRHRLFCLSLILTSTMMLAHSNPIPLINQPLVPASTAPGGNAFTLTVNGTGFTSTAAVYWNGSIRPTTVVSSSTVTAQISATDIAKPGFGWVTVGNLGTGEVQSNVVYFSIRDSAKGLGFLPRSIQHAANIPGPTIVGDFNNDGFLDFAVGGGAAIQIYLGKGDGTFQLPVTYPTTGISSIMAGDFNGDGNLDLALTHQPSGRACCAVIIFLGKGDGTFTRLKDLVLSKPISVSAADFNGDGKLDLYFYANPARGCFDDGAPCFGVLLGNGDGTFTGDSFARNGPLPLGSGNPAIADFNGDGNLDVAVGGTNFHGKGEVTVYLGDGKGGFNRGASYPMPFAGESLAAADVNGDGKIDLISDGVSVLLGNGDGTFRKGASVPSGGSGSVNIGDFNGDGKLDVAAGVNILLGNGDGTFQKPFTFAGMSSSGFPVSMGGFNANGDLDLLGVNGLNGSLSIFVQFPIYLTPTNLGFGRVKVGTTSQPLSANLTNFDSKNLVISSINFSGHNATDFAQTNNCGSTLPPDQTCQIQVTFSPTVKGKESAALNVNRQGLAPFSMPVSGIGTIQPPMVTLLPSSLKFPAQRVGTTSAPQPATLTNTGEDPVTISQIAATTPFSQTNNCPSTLPVGGSCQIQVTFTPTSRGVATGTLSVTDNAVGSPQTVDLTGIGIGPHVVLSPTSVDFGNQKVGTSSASIPITLSNKGEVLLTIAEIVIKGTDPNDFTQTNNCGNTVPPHSQCTISVTFTPTVKGPRSANVSISDDAPPSPQTVPLSGKGT